MMLSSTLSLPSPMRRWTGLALPLLAVLAAPPAAAEFAVAISPPRFELEAKAGQVLRQTMEITNAAAQAISFKLKTADWSYAQDGSVSFTDELSPGSCRPWVAIERRELTASPGRPYRFRFEITPPAGTPPTECRFAIMVEGPEERTDAGGVVVPFNARMAVVVYVAVGGAQPQLGLAGTLVQMVDGRPTPMVRIRNTGLAHGRLGGFLTGADADGVALEFTPANSPILPGETRAVPLQPSRPGDPESPATPRFPVTAKGRLEWGNNQSQDVDLRFSP
jgi:hypothetical protein